MRIVALIPARAGSKRIPGKNTRLLGGRPLIQWTIEAAKESGVFSAIAVSTEDDATVQIAWNCGILGWRRQWEHAQDDSPDIAWVRDIMRAEQCQAADAFAILRPTSPFRTADTIRRAVAQFTTAKCSSLRAVERVKQHPGKMWELFYPNVIKPLMDGSVNGTPYHSMPTQSLLPMLVQNSSLEIAWTWCVDIFGTISGPKVAPFFTEGYEGLAIDYPEDFERAERIVAALQAQTAAE